MLRLQTFGGLSLEAADGSALPKPRPRRLALLAILAASGPRGIGRDRVRAVFWPDSEEEGARHALRQTLYALQRDLGARAIVAGPDLQLDPGLITTDIDAFRAAVSRRDWRAACDAYRGTFAAGFSIADAPEFELWLEGQRMDWLRQALAAVESLARQAEVVGDRHQAAAAWRRLTELDPLSGRLAASYMSALAALGDHSGALAHAREHAAQVRRDLDTEPDPTIGRLDAKLRAVIQAAASPASIAGPPPNATDTTATPSGEANANAVLERTPLRQRGQWLAGLRWTWVGGSVAAAALLVVAAALARSGSARGPMPVLAVGQVRDLTIPDSSRSGLSEVLTTSFARLPQAEVIANSRIIELLDPASVDEPAARSEAARRAGATEVIEGELLPAGGDRLRLVLRRVDLRRGSVRGGYAVTGTDWLSLIDSATSLIAGDLRLAPPERSLRELTPRSRAAARLFDEGLHAFFAAKTDMALRLFQAALAEDSTYAMAAYYAHRANYDLRWRDAAYEVRALALSARASDRDRLVIQTAIRKDQHDTLATVYADSLAARFPRDPEALMLAAGAMTHARLVSSRERDLYERAIAIDSAAGLDPDKACRACKALSELVIALQSADSLPAAESVAKRWWALRPYDAGPVGTLAMLHYSQGRYDSAARVLAALPVTAADEGPGLVFLGRLLNGLLDQADEYCTIRLPQEDPRGVASYRWLCAIVWRNQGRLRDAESLVFSSRLPDGRRLPGPMARDAVGEYVLHLESGRPREALRTLEAVAPRRQDSLPIGLFAREMTWNLTRRATAASSAGELEMARRLADSAEALGRVSLYGRDRLLHYFIRGLIARAAGDHETAVDFFRRSIFSPTYGYTRANYELAGSLLVLKRPAEAIGPLQAALRGGWDGSNLYLTRTELHERLAMAFAAIDRRDSAAAHYRLVERAWRRADPRFTARYQAAREFLAQSGAQ